MASWEPAQSLLLALPDPCLLAVLRYTYVDDDDDPMDPRSLFSAARAHSRLHQAAAVVATSIRAEVTQQQQVDSMLLYLTNHGQYISSLDLEGPLEGMSDPTITLQHLPHDTLQGLSNIEFSYLRLQLQPGGRFQGVLRAGAPLKRLYFCQCRLLDGEEGLATVLPLLPQLQDLDVIANVLNWPAGAAHRTWPECFPRSTVPKLQQLTSLELSGCELKDPDGLEHLQGLTSLEALSFDGRAAPVVKAGMLSGFKQLTRLCLDGDNNGEVVEPDALAGQTQLQRLAVFGFRIAGESAATTEFLFHLQHMQQLTFLKVRCSLIDADAVAPAGLLSTDSQRQAAVPVPHGMHLARRRVAARVCSWQAAAESSRIRRQ
jgi:hypothetical protein